MIRLTPGALPQVLPGMCFHEELAGRYWRLDDPAEERPMNVHLVVRAADVGVALQTRSFDLSGTVRAPGLASDGPVEGRVAFKVFDEGRLPYRFTFRGDDGGLYECSGQKEWSVLAPLQIVTTLCAGLYDERGVEIGRADLRFDLRGQWVGWLRGLRLVTPRGGGKP